MARKKRKKLKQFDFKVSPKFIWGGSIFLAALILLSLLGYLIYTCPVFKIKENNIKSDLPLSLVLKQKIEGQSIFKLNIKDIASRLIDEYPEYKGVYVLREFPSTLLIKAQKRKPFAQLKERRFYLIDKEATIISNGLKEPQPGIIPIEISDYDRFLRKGKVVEDIRLAYAFELIDALGEQDFFDPTKVELINATQADALYFMIPGEAFGGKENWQKKDIRVIIGKDNFAKKIMHLKEVIGQQIQDKISSVEYIDLRYKKVYVGFRR